jgi:nitrate/TMAO reductase-like tetraheme cytochrome c subunit
MSTWLRSLSRRAQITVQVGVGLVIVLLLGTVGFVEYSGQPSFCLNCHIMEPYYESWQTSSHNDVKCIECHYAPGIKAEAMGKFQAANQVVKYVTGSYGTKPWAEIEDAACLRSGCHSERKLEGVVAFQGIRFDHTQHLGELRRGKQLRCTSCHSQIVQGDHLAVTISTCNLCHFKDRPADQPIAGCTGCHRTLPRVESPAGFVVDHDQYVQDLTSCTGCHAEVTVGNGEAERDRCFTCHNRPERVAEFDDVTLVHQVHIAQHNVECQQCHTPIEHRLVALEATFELDCQGCHQRAHDEQRRMYAGIGGHGTEDMPSAMYQARVSCQGCHALPTEIRGHEEVQLAGEATCLSCHGIRYANILPAWQDGIRGRVTQVAGVVSAARRTLGSASVAGRAGADSLIRLAEENVEFVSRGKGAHNIAYADQLLVTAVDLVRDAVQLGRLPYRVPDVALGTSVGENVCLRCHLGQERRRVEFQGGPFDHAPHVLGGMTCSNCHTSLDQHGGTTLTDRASCDGCHHRRVEPLVCGRCHEGPGGAPAAVRQTPIGQFSHTVHREGGLPCAVCHTAPDMSPETSVCEGCHALHHQPEASCVACHAEGAMAIHPRVAHDGCEACHGERVAGITQWTRQVCTVCHVDRVEHNAPMDCVICHRIPALGEPDPDQAEERR